MKKYKIIQRVTFARVLNVEAPDTISAARQIPPPATQQTEAGLILEGSGWVKSEGENSIDTINDLE